MTMSPGSPARGQRVLVVDDETNLLFLITSALKVAGFETCGAATGAEALAEVARFGPDIIVLDVGLPDVDGFTLLRRIRATGSAAPILFLTARRETADRVKGLTIGGDDYIVKPFELEELVARVQVAGRRLGGGPKDHRLVVADLEMDLDAHRVWRAGEEVQLSPTEFSLLRYLMVNAGRALSRDKILDTVWQYDFEGDSSVIETFISNLRRKVDRVEPRLIHTVRGVGYSVREPR